MTGMRKYLPWASLGLCAVLALLLLIDLIWPGLMLFLRGPAKLYCLITVLVTSASALLAIAVMRNGQRRAARRRPRR